MFLVQVLEKRRRRKEEGRGRGRGRGRRRGGGRGGRGGGGNVYFLLKNGSKYPYLNVYLAFSKEYLQKKKGLF